MANALNPIANMYQSQLEASRRFADALFSGTEKLDRVVIEATHRAVKDQLDFAHALASTRDARGIANLQSTLFAQRPDSAMSYQKEVMRVLAEVQNEIGRSMQDYIEQWGTTFASSATTPIKAVQEQASDTAFNPMTGMFSIWESAFREVASLANKNIAAARSSFESVAKAASGAAQQAAGAATQAASMTAGAASGVETRGSGEEKKVQSGSAGGGKRK